MDDVEDGRKNAVSNQQDRWAVAVYDFEGDAESQVLSVRAGDIVLVSPREGKDWWPANANGKVGFLPRNYLKLKSANWSPQDISSLIQSAKRSAEYLDDEKGGFDDSEDDDEEESEDDDEEGEDFELAIGLYNFSASHEDQLSFEKGDELYVHKVEGEQWWPAEKDGETGLVPFNYIKILESSDEESEEEDEEEDEGQIEDEVDELQVKSVGNVQPATPVSDHEKEEQEDDDDDRMPSDDDEEEEDQVKGGEHDSRQDENGSVAICQYDFFAREKGELSFSKGDFLWVSPLKGVEWWMAHNDRGKQGFVPCNYLKMVKVSSEIIEQPQDTFGSYPLSDQSVLGRTSQRRDSFAAVDIVGLSERDHAPTSVKIRNFLFFRILFQLAELDEQAIASLEGDPSLFSFCQVEAGEVLYDESDATPIDSLFMVVQGRAEITYQKRHLMVLSSGQWFGERFVFDGSEASYRVGFRAIDSTTFMILTRENLFRLAKSHPEIKKQLQKIATLRSSIGPVSSMDILSQFSADQKEILGSLFTFKLFRPSEAIFKQGEQSNELFVIVAGEGIIPEQNGVVVSGESFGEECFFNNDPKSYSVLSSSKGIVAVVMSTDDVANFLDTVPGNEDVAQVLCIRNSVDTIRNIPLFESVPSEKLQEIAGLCKFRTFSTGEIIVRAGDAGTEFFIIVGGKVAIDLSKPGTNQNSNEPPQKDNQREVLLGPKEYFGEIAILQTDVRSATVVVREGPCKCIVLDGEDFRTFLVDCPQIKRDVVEKISKRLKRASIEPRSSMRLSSRNLVSSLTLSTMDDDLNEETRESFKSPRTPLHRLSKQMSFSENRQLEWITTSIESLAALHPGDTVRDQESIDAITVWQQLGQTMQDCHILYDCWPVYIIPSTRTDLMAPFSTILIKIMGLDELIRETTVLANTDWTVAQVIEKAFHNVEKTGRIIDPLGPDLYAMKIQSRNDFLVYRHIPLRQYKFIAKLCRQQMSVCRVTTALVDLRNPPSSNGSGVHALKFLTKSDAEIHEGSKGRYSSRTSSISSESTILSTTNSYDDDKSSRGGGAGSSSSEQHKRLEKQKDDAKIGPEQPNDGFDDFPPPPPPPSDAEDLYLPGLPDINPEEWSRMMINVTKRALQVKDTWEEVNRNNMIAAQNSWPLRVNIIGLQDTQFNLEKFVTCESVCLRFQLVYASTVLETKFSKPFKPDGFTMRLNDWVWFDLSLSCLPLTTRLCITLYDLSRYGSNTTELEQFYSSHMTSSNHRSQSNVPVPMSQQNSLEMPGTALAGASIQIFDQRHVFQSGLRELVLWDGQSAEKRLFCLNAPLTGIAKIILKFDEFLKPVYHGLLPVVSKKEFDNKPSFHSRGSSMSSLGSMDELVSVKSLSVQTGVKESQSHSSSKGHKRSPSSGSKKSGLLSILKWGGSSSPSNPLSEKRRTRADTDIPPDVSDRTFLLLTMDSIQVYSMSKADKITLWNDRLKLIGMSKALSRVMFAVDWTDFEQRTEALELLGEWQPPSHFQALELLDCVQGDYRVREYAVRCLESASDDELLELLIQLTQVLKYEAYHESPLSRFLLRRAWQNPREVGTRLFWSLRAEMHNMHFSHRFGLILQAYLRNSSPFHLQELSQQLDVQNFLKLVADGVVSKKFSSKMDRLKFVRDELEKVNVHLPSSFQLCLDPKVVLRGLVVQSCKVMNSKKKPLWLKFRSIDPDEGGGEPTLVMFKCGDDLRQDQMTLQMLRIMNQLWLEEGLDLRLTLYGCISTGDELGMLEIVTEAETIAGIQKKHGKLGALSARSLRIWLQDCNPGQDFSKVVENFVHSCAGYCVATYVLGIGDRHADNIMMKRNGKLFHIDFGHFLGHFKSKFGLKRERTPFVFTKEMAFVMGGKNEKPFQNFVEICCKAYNILRRHGNDLINLFRLMIPAGMPELTCAEDIQYMCDKLALDKTDEEAADLFKREIQNSLNDTYRRVDNVIHNFKTG